METINAIIQIAVGLLILNVWTLRSNRSTKWRGGNAKTMQEEFSAYGLPDWFKTVVGWTKVTFALMLIVGVWFSPLTKPAAVGLAILMAGAVAMHAKIKDPLFKSYPASSILILCTVLVAA